MPSFLVLVVLLPPALAPPLLLLMAALVRRARGTSKPEVDAAASTSAFVTDYTGRFASWPSLLLL